MNIRLCITTLFLLRLTSSVSGKEIDLTEDYRVLCSQNITGWLLSVNNEWQNTRVDRTGIIRFDTSELRRFRQNGIEPFMLDYSKSDALVGSPSIDIELIDRGSLADDRRLNFKCTGGVYLSCANFDDDSRSLGVLFVLNLATLEGFVSRVLNPVEYETNFEWREMYNKREGARLGDNLNTQIKSEEYLNSMPRTELSFIKCSRSSRR